MNKEVLVRVWMNEKLMLVDSLKYESTRLFRVKCLVNNDKDDVPIQPGLSSLSSAKDCLMDQVHH